MFVLLERGISPRGSISADEMRKEGPIHVSIPDDKLDPYLKEVEEGGYILDKWDTGDAGVDQVMNGPMVGVFLKEKPPPTEIPDFVLPLLTGVCLEMAMKARNNPKCRYLDVVPLLDYLEEWRKIPGCKIGQRKGEFIYWETGETTKIPS